MIKNNYYIYFTLYSLAYIFMLLNIDGIYWDDSILVKQNLDDLVFHFKQAGVGIAGSIHYYLGQIGNGIFIYRFLTFVMMFLVVIFLDKIMKKKFINEDFRTYLLLFFLLSPLFLGRVALINFAYTLGYFLFFLAFYMLSKKDISFKFDLYRLIILILFFMSFIINSILLFYIIVLGYIFYNETQNNNKIKDIIIKNLDFILLPILFYIFKSQFMQPETIYTGYNKITIDGLLSAIVATFSSLKMTFLGYFIMPVDIIKNAYFPFDSWFSIVVIFTVITIITAIVMKFIATTNEKQMSLKILFFMFIFGIFLFYIASFPAYVVHKIPNPLTFNSRLELLMPLGWSLMIVSFIFFIGKLFKIPTFITKFIFIVILGYYITFTTITMLQFHKDTFVQKSLIVKLKESSELNEANRIVFYDYNRYDHVYRRKYAWYEYNNILKIAYGNQARFATDYLDKRPIEHFEKYIKYPTYNFVDYKIGKVDYNVWIRDGSYKLTLNNTIKLVYYCLFDINKYNAKIRDVIKLSIIKV